MEDLQKIKKEKHCLNACLKMACPGYLAIKYGICSCEVLMGGVGYGFFDA